MKKQDFLFVGVGGQGIILASDVVAAVGLRAGYDVKKSEIHGMAQRGGSVESYVRWGDKVYSPLAERGTVDYLIAFELLEAARWADRLAPGGVAILNTMKMPPLAVASGTMAYPPEEAIVAAYRSRTDRIRLVDALTQAQKLGSAAVLNVVLLGVLSRELDIAPEIWQEVIEERVPKRAVEINRQAFWAGRNYGSSTVA